MRLPTVLLGLVVFAAACSSSSTTSTNTATGPTTTTISLPSAGTTSSTGGSPTTSTSFSDSSSTTSVNVTPVADSICEPYLDYLAAFDRRHELDALRRFDIARGLQPGADTLAIAVLRERPLGATISASEARETLVGSYGPACGEPNPGDAGHFDRLLTAGVIVARSGLVELLDGTLVIAEDPEGSYVDAYGSRVGGILALEEIGGLEVIEYRAGNTAIPQDLALNADMRLHGIAVVDDVEHAMVTTWETTGEFGEEVQFLDLFPLDGASTTRVGVVGTVADAAETISFAGGYFLVTEAFLGGSDIYALGLDGQRREVPGLPLVGQGAPGVDTLPLQRARVDLRGERFAYLRVTPGAGSGDVDVLETELVVQRLDDGTEEMIITIGGRDEIFTSLDYDGHWALAARTGKLVVVDTWAEDGPEVTELSVDGIVAARFLDGPLLIGQ